MNQTSHEGPQLKALEEEAQFEVHEEEARFKEAPRFKVIQGQKWQWNPLSLVFFVKLKCWTDQKN